MESPTAALLQEAARLHGQGALEEAASRYRQVLESEPDHAGGALPPGGDLRASRASSAKASSWCGGRLRVDPRQPRAHNLLGMALSRLGRQQDALASFDDAIAQQPDLADAHGNRARP